MYVVVVVVSHIQRIGCQPEKTTLHGGQSRSWSAEQGKEYVVCEESMRRSYARVPYVGSIFRSTPQLSVTLGLVPWPV